MRTGFHEVTDLNIETVIYFANTMSVIVLYLTPHKAILLASVMPLQLLRCFVDSKVLRFVLSLMDVVFLFAPSHPGFRKCHPKEIIG